MTATTLPTTHDVRHIIEAKHGHLTNVYGSRIQVEGSENGFAGYGLVVVAEGMEARREFKGPMVAGPWATTYGLCTVLDNHGGTGADVARERETQRCFSVNVGDMLRLTDTMTVVVSLDKRRYPVLTVVA